MNSTRIVMKKYICTLVSLLSVLSGMSSEAVLAIKPVAKFADDTSVDEITEEELERNYASVELGQRFTEVIQALPELDYEEISDCYGGAFVDSDNILVINYVNYYEQLQILVDGVNVDLIEYRLEPVKYTAGSLKDIMDYIDTKYAFTYESMGCSQKENSIKLKVETEEIKDTIFYELFDHYSNFDPDMIEVTYGTSTATLTNSTEMMAGEQIRKLIAVTDEWIDYSRGTIGFNAVDEDGMVGIVTNGHVAEKGDHVFDSDWNYIGKCTISVTSETVDASFIPFKDQTQWNGTQSIKSNDPSFRLAGASKAFEGAKVWKIGDTLGSSYGTITDIDYRFTLVYSDGPHHMTGLIESDCPCAKGDSGGPLIHWRQRNSNRYLFGIDFALVDNTTITCGIDNVLNALGVNLY